MKRVIRFWTSWNKDPAAWLRRFELDPNRYEMVFDAADPEYIFASSRIYMQPAVRDEFLRIYSPDRVSIFYADECVFPDMNLFDYAVTYSRGIEMEGRVFRRTCRSSHSASVFRPLSEGCASPSSVLAGKDRFCNFIYSNPHAHPHRDWLFHTLSSYKRIDSLGPHMNNVGNVPDRMTANWRQTSVEQRHPYRFSIAAENALSCGYTSEKIILCFMARTIPIYWGDPTVVLEFNERAFVNANGLSAEELIARVREIEEDRDRLEGMLAEPPMTAGQCREAEAHEARYKAFAEGIFAVPPAAAKRVPLGTWMDVYRNSMRASAPQAPRTLLKLGRLALVRNG